MRHSVIFLLVAASIVSGDALIGGASSLAETPIMEPCSGLQGDNARDCLDAYELLTSEPPEAPQIDVTIGATRAAGGWLYRFPDDERDAWEQTCPDDGPLVLPVSTTVELLLTGDDTLYEWSVPTLGLDIALIPGRVESFVTRVDEAGDFDGSIADISGTPVESADGSLRAVEQTAFESWKATALARKC